MALAIIISVGYIPVVVLIHEKQSVVAKMISGLPEYRNLARVVEGDGCVCVPLDTSAESVTQLRMLDVYTYPPSSSFILVVDNGGITMKEMQEMGTENGCLRLQGEMLREMEHSNILAEGAAAEAVKSTLFLHLLGCFLKAETDTMSKKFRTAALKYLPYFVELVKAIEILVGRSLTKTAHGSLANHLQYLDDYGGGICLSSPKLV